MEQQHGTDYVAGNNMAEKVIKRLDFLLKDTNLLENFCIIPSTTNSSDRNVSPVQYIAVEHSLGLESWCVTHIFKYAQQQILKLRQITLRKPTAESVSKLNMYLNVALLIQPDVNTFWNIKRELNMNLDHCTEMHFTKLVLSHKPKSLQTYTYRIWLVNKQLVDSDICAGSESGVRIIHQELVIVNKAVNCPNNYHAWNHRIWCMECLLPKIPNSNIIIDELHYSADFVSKHVSEHSGFHYRQYILKQFQQRFFYPTSELIQLTQFFSIGDCCRIINSLIHEQYFRQLDPKLIAMCNQYVSLLLCELFEVCKELNVRFPAHESVWYHRRFIFYEIIGLLRNIYETKVDSNVNDVQMNCNDGKATSTSLMKESTFYKNLLVYEKNFLDLLETKHKYDLFELTFIKKHKNWLRYVMNVDLYDDTISLNNGEILFRL